MAAISMAELEPVRVTVGVDTHKDLHVARAKDQLGRRLGEVTVPASVRGYGELLGWARSLGEIRTFGVEGTGCYGAGVTRYLRGKGVVVVEVIPPNRQARRRNGKSDPADADAAATAVLSGEASGLPKAGDATVEMIRALRVARTTAIRARTRRDYRCSPGLGSGAREAPLGWSVVVNGSFSGAPGAARARMGSAECCSKGSSSPSPASRSPIAPARLRRRGRSNRRSPPPALRDLLAASQDPVPLATPSIMPDPQWREAVAGRPSVGRQTVDGGRSDEGSPWVSGFLIPQLSLASATRRASRSRPAAPSARWSSRTRP